MSWSFCEDADVFLSKRRDVLLAEESINCLAWAAIARSKRKGGGPPAYRFLVFQSGAEPSAHAFLQDAEQHIVLGAMMHTQVQSLVTFLVQHERSVRTIEGPWQVAEEFSSRWSRFTQSPCETQMEQGLYELTAVEMPEPRGGKLVQVQPEHRSMLRAWVMGFLSSISGEAMAPDALERRVERFIDEKRAYFWQEEDQSFVAMAAIVRESPNTASISWVYTPPPYRRRGYAARTVASLSQAQLDAGKHACNLHTDLANPTSNRVYRSIGFKMIARSLRIRVREG